MPVEQPRTVESLVPTQKSSLSAFLEVVVRPFAFPRYHLSKMVVRKTAVRYLIWWMPPMDELNALQRWWWMHEYGGKG